MSGQYLVASRQLSRCLLATSYWLLFSCSNPPIAPDPGPVTPPFPLPTAVPSVASDIEGLQRFLTSEGVTVTVSQAQAILIAIDAPVANWAALVGQTSETLAAHFDKYAKTFSPPPATAEAYAAAARAFAENDDPSAGWYLDSRYLEARGQVIVIKWSPATGEFVVKRPTGEISTYLRTNRIGPPRYIALPEPGFGF